MVDLIESYSRQPAAQPEVEQTERADHEWSRNVPWLLVALAVGFSAWYLRTELNALPYPNDGSVHASMARFAETRIRAGHNPFDAWYPYLGLGAPQFSQYQSLSHILTGFLSIPFGDSAFRWIQYLLMCTWPVTMYAGSRLLGFDRWEAAATALLSPMLVNVVGYGFEWASFVWLGSGMWSMLWGLWLLPLALGLAWRAVAHRERIALAAFVVGLICALHFVTGYLVLWSLGVFVIVRPSEFVKRLGRAAVVGVGGLLIFTFVFVPTITGLPYVTVDAFLVGTFWVNSYGPAKVFGWLFSGEIYDFARFPVVSLLVALGAAVCIVRARRSEIARVPLGLMAVSLALYSGHRVVGPLMDRLPGGSSILLHRYIIGVHFAGMLLAGIGAVWAFRLVLGAFRFAPRVSRGRAVAAALACVLAVFALYPVVMDRREYAGWNTYFVDGQHNANEAAGRDVTALIDIAKQRNDGRVYAGSSSNWGTEVKVDQVPLYQFAAQQDADSLGFYLRTWSLSSNVEPYFNDLDAAQYDLFNIKYVLLANPSRPAVPATLLATRGNYSLWQVPTSGYLEVVDTTEPIHANNENMAAVMSPYISSAAVAQHRHPLVAFDGHSTPQPSLSSSAPDLGPPGSITWSDFSFENGRFSGGVHTTRDAWVMLKESYSPRWTAYVDGERVDTSMVAPSFVGVPVPAGDHIVVFKYEPNSSYPLLFVFGAVVLLALVFGPALLRRYRAGRRSSVRSQPAAG